MLQNDDDDDVHDVTDVSIMVNNTLTVSDRYKIGERMDAKT